MARVSVPKMSDTDEVSLLAFFRLESSLREDNRVDKAGLEEIFKHVNFKPSASEMKVFEDILDANGGIMSSQ